MNADNTTAHEPRTRAEFRASALDLLARGYALEDVAELLGLTARAVLDLLPKSGDAA